MKKFIALGLALALSSCYGNPALAIDAAHEPKVYIEVK